MIANPNTPERLMFESTVTPPVAQSAQGAQKAYLPYSPRCFWERHYRLAAPESWSADRRNRFQNPNRHARWRLERAYPSFEYAYSFQGAAICSAVRHASPWQPFIA